MIKIIYNLEMTMIIMIYNLEMTMIIIIYNLEMIHDNGRKFLEYLLTIEVLVNNSVLNIYSSIHVNL